MSVSEMESKAISLLDEPTKVFYVDGSDDQITLKENRKAYDRFYIIPRFLVGLKNIDTSCSIFGKKYSMPIHCAPTSIQKMAHPDGEAGTAKACKDKNVIMCISTVFTSTLDEITENNSSPGTRWMQIYILKERSKTLKQIKMAERYNFEALVVTIDSPVIGNRRASKKLKITNKPFIKECVMNMLDESEANKDEFIFNFFLQADSSISWNDIKWLRSITNMKIIVKGVNSVEDALIAVNVGCDAVWISNHGGRQLDSAVASIYLLPPIKRALINCEIPIFIDSGIVSGMNAFKALAMGADAVFVGRPVLWGLTIDGSKGVSKMLDLLHEELTRTMVLSGCSNIDSIRNVQVVHKNLLSKL